MDGCNENVIEFMTNGTRATYHSHRAGISLQSASWQRSTQKIAGSLRITRTEAFVLMFQYPASDFSAKQYTEDQRQQMGERLKQNRSENTATQG